MYAVNTRRITGPNIFMAIKSSMWTIFWSPILYRFKWRRKNSCILSAAQCTNTHCKKFNTGFMNYFWWTSRRGLCPSHLLDFNACDFYSWQQLTQNVIHKITVHKLQNFNMSQNLCWCEMCSVVQGHQFHQLL